MRITKQTLLSNKITNKLWKQKSQIQYRQSRDKNLRIKSTIRQKINKQKSLIKKLMGMFRFLFKWSLEITGSLIVGYNYGLKPQQQANLYGFYRSCSNSYRAAFHVYAAINDYKALLSLKENREEYTKQLNEVNANTAKRLQELSRLNKGVYMRLGQYIGHLKYAFPPEFYTVLKQLNDKPDYQIEDYKYLKKHIESKLGKTTRQTFETLNTSPIKSDLFYQIYKGELAENFLDVTIKIVHPHAESQAKYDFWFMRKVIDYVKDFKQKNFTQNYPLYLDLLYYNLKSSVKQELDLLSQQRTSLEIRQKITALVSEQKSKIGARPLPVYTPHIYSQYTKNQLMIQEYFDGYHLSNADALFKQNFNQKNVASDIISIWNTLFEKNQLFLDNYTPFDLFIRKSRPTEEGPYQLCLLNTGLVSSVPDFFVQPYASLWKDIISGKKINPKKPEQRIQSVRSFYESLSQTYFTLFLKENDKVIELAQKANIEPVTVSQGLIDLANSELPKEVSLKLQQKKFLQVSKNKQTPKVSEQTRKQYDNQRRAFQLKYQPWKLQTLFQTYKEIFREEKHFGVF